MLRTVGTKRSITAHANTKESRPRSDSSGSAGPHSQRTAGDTLPETTRASFGPTVKQLPMLTRKKLNNTTGKQKDPLAESMK